MNKSVIIGIFGKKAGTKLYQWLNPCCDQFCLDVNACIGGSPSGNFISGTYETPSDGNSVYEIPLVLGGATPSWGIAIAGSITVANQPFYVTLGVDKIIINFSAPVPGGSQLVFRYAYQV